MKNIEKVSSEKFNGDSAETLNMDGKDTLHYLKLIKLPNDKQLKVLSLAKQTIDKITGADDDISGLKIGLEEPWKGDLVELVGQSDQREVYEARKLFCASVIKEFASGDKDVKNRIYMSLLRHTPNIASNCGDVEDYVELLSLAGRSGDNNNPCENALYGELMLQIQPDGKNEFDEIMQSSNPVRQLRFLPVFRGIFLQSGATSWSQPIQRKIEASFEDLAANKKTTPLVRIVATSFAEQTKSALADVDSPEYAKYVLGDRKIRNAILDRQQALHEEFPLSLDNKNLIKVAPDFVGILGRDSHQIKTITNKNGDLLAPSETDPDSVFLLTTAHHPEIKALIDDRLGIDLADVSLDAQIQLLKFMTEADDGRFDRLCSTLREVDEKMRLKLAEGFLSADFGEDFGDALLTIAGSEKLNDKEKGEVFDTISSCRKSIHKIVRLYSEIDDGQFMQEYARAANERLTDATMVFSRIAEKGIASADLDWAGTPEFNFDSAMEALNYEAKSLEIISGTLDDVATGKEGAFAEIAQHPNSDQSSLWRTVYNFYSPNHGYILLYTRPEGSNSLDPAVDYGKKRNRYDTESANVGVEASISLIVNPVNPFSFPNPYKPDLKKMKDPLYYDSSKMDKVSAIRLDREGRAPGMSADDPKRDPVNTVGMVSVDLAAIGDRADTPSGKIARLLSVGGRLREEASGVESSLNHNTRWFSQKQYGTAEGFRRLVEYIDGMAQEWCVEHGPKKDDESFSRKMKQARGNKARRAA